MPRRSPPPEHKHPPRRIQKPRAEQERGGVSATITPDNIKEIGRRIRAGSFPIPAALSLGIDGDVYKEYMSRGAIIKDPTTLVRKVDKLAYELFREVMRAENDSELGGAALLRKMAQTDRQALVAWIEKRHRKNWGHKQEVKIELETALVEMVAVVRRVLGDEQAERVMAELASIGGDEAADRNQD